jgi:hypothetical protein
MISADGFEPMRRIRLNQRLDQLIAQAEQRRLPSERRPFTRIYITGGLPNQQAISQVIGQFRIYGGLPRLPYPPSETQLLRQARQRLTDALVARINSLWTAATPLCE